MQAKILVIVNKLGEPIIYVKENEYLGRYAFTTPNEKYDKDSEDSKEILASFFEFPKLFENEEWASVRGKILKKRTFATPKAREAFFEEYGFDLQERPLYNEIKEMLKFVDINIDISYIKE